jgi:cadherin-related tumor suppressor
LTWSFKLNIVNYFTFAEEAASSSPDPMSIALILVILFFVILILVTSTSFIIFHHQKNKQMRNCVNHARKMGIKHPFVHQINGSSSQSSTLLHTSLHNQTLLSQSTAPQPPTSIIKQRPPDIIESPPLAPPVTSRAPPAPPLSYLTPFSDNYSDVIGSGNHYDLENASSIEPSEFDLVYRYKGFRSGRESTQPQSQHRHAPLARISPSVSELTAPRILTLQDLSSQRVPSCPPPSMAPPPLPSLPAKRQPILTPSLDANDDGDNSDGTYNCSEYNSNYKFTKKSKNIMFERVW